MKTLHKKCAGVDVHKTEVVACLRVVTHRKVEREVPHNNTATWSNGKGYGIFAWTADVIHTLDLLSIGRNGATCPIWVVHVAALALASKGVAATFNLAIAESVLGY